MTFGTPVPLGSLAASVASGAGESCGEANATEGGDAGLPHAGTSAGDVGVPGAVAAGAEDAPGADMASEVREGAVALGDGGGL